MTADCKHGNIDGQCWECSQEYIADEKAQAREDLEVERIRLLEAVTEASRVYRQSRLDAVWLSAETLQLAALRLDEALAALNKHDGAIRLENRNYRTILEQIIRCCGAGFSRKQVAKMAREALNLKRLKLWTKIQALDAQEDGEG